MTTTTTRQARAAQVQEERDRRAAKNTAWLKQPRPERFERQAVPQHGDIIQTPTGQYRYSDYTPAQQPATPIQNAPGPNTRPIGADVRQPTQKQTYIIRDTLGREQEISEEQKEQLEKQQAKRKSSENWTVLPEEVANAGSEWWINDLGLFEWTPITEGDKQHLEKINKQRAQFGKAPTNTLTTGAAWSDEFRDDWYSTGGKRTVAPKGSGGEKLDKLRGSSTINVSATAKTGTAQDAKARIITLEPPKPVTELQPSPKSSAPKIQIENPFAGSEPGWSIKTNDPVADQVAKALQEAKKVNPSGSEKYFEGVANVARRKQMSPLEVLRGDLTHADKQVSKAASPLFDLAERGKSKYDAALEGVSLSFTEKGKISISKKGAEPVDAGLTVGAKTAHDQFIGENRLLAGTASFLDSEYEKFKTKPVSAGLELGAYYAGGAAAGAAIKGGTIATRKGLEFAATKTGDLATKSGAVGLKQLSTISKYGAEAAEPLINVGMVGALGAHAKETYQTEGVAGVEKLGLELAIGAGGFKRGAKAAESAYDVLRTAGKTRVPTTDIIQPDIVAGKAQLPMTRPGETAPQVIEDFSAGTTAKGWHATSDRALLDAGSIRPGINQYGEIAKARPGDNPGLYVSGEQVGLSPHFLRVQKQGSTTSLVEGLTSYASAGKKIAAGTAQATKGKAQQLGGAILRSEPIATKGRKTTEAGITEVRSGLSELSSPLDPQAVHFEISGGVRRLPEAVRRDTNKADDFLAGRSEIGTPDKGAAYLTTKLERNIKTGRAEHEATIVPGTKFEVVESSKFFELHGRRIPITETKTVLEPGTYRTGKEVSVQGAKTTPKNAKPIEELYRRDGTGKGPIREAGAYRRGGQSPAARPSYRPSEMRDILPAARPSYRPSEVRDIIRPPRPDFRRRTKKEKIEPPRFAPSTPQEKHATADAWGKRMKKHYVLDPESFVLGKRRR
ncbi:MAG: hypothetical protein [Methanosarcina spindle-shaped virus 1]